MSRLPVLYRLMLAVYLLTLTVSLMIGWIGADVARDQVEARLVHDMVRNAAATLERLNLRPSGLILENLSRIAGGPLLVARSAGGEAVGSTLAPAATREVLRAARTQADSVSLEGQLYVIGRSSFPGADSEMLLVLLVPSHHLDQARHEVNRRIFAATGAVIALATILVVALSLSITRPLRRLGAEMDRLSRQMTETPDRPVAVPETAASAGPRDVAQLADSFHRLLTNLNAAQNKLTHFERLAALGRVAATVAHELRNPLSGIRMHLRLLADSAPPDDKDTAESLAIIQREIERMDLFLEELMGLGRDPSRAAREPVEPVSLAREISQVVRLLDGKLRHAGVAVKEEFADGVPSVAAIPGRIRQVMMNLLLNALEAAPAGEPIVITLNHTGNFVRVAVRDRGSGVHQEKDIFEAFVTSKVGGGGLGLYVCRQIVQEFGGSIGFNNCDPGAEFWFELPVATQKNGEGV